MDPSTTSTDFGVERACPEVTVIIPSFNYRDYIEQALESVLKQTFKNYEVIVVDDGSNDGSYEFLKTQYAAKGRIKLICHENHKNLGLSKSLELGLSRAEGDWIAILECDDMWEPDCLERRVAAVQKSASIYFCSNKIRILRIDEASGWLDDYVLRVQSKLSLRQKEKTTSGFKVGNEIYYENLFPTFSCMFFKKDVLKRLNFSSPVTSWLDWYLYIQLTKVGDCCFLDEPLTLWRIHKDSQNSKNGVIRYLSDFYKFRKAIFKQITEDRELEVSLISRFFFLFLFESVRYRLIEQGKQIGFFNLFKQVVRRFYGK